ncbi:NAD(P)H-binding protein [Kribbella sp. NPDC023855]|uniref:NmrA family NAD(P)-binding protein n=1 Tax=Kribbella sp. NPDC023855 TaxID=3154698 RepID=UPI0034027B17
MTILVLGATGKTGRRVVAQLRAEGNEVRAASRSGEVRFDWNEPAGWAAVLEGVRAVYLVAPDDPAPTEGFVKQAVQSGVERFVVLSGRGIDQADKEAWAGMREGERAVAASGVGWTVLRANNFNQNFSEDLWREPVLAGRLALPMGAVGEPFIDVQDIAEVAALALTGDGHSGQVYELSGPESLTFAEAARIIAEVRGKPIEYVELSPAEYREELLTAGYPAEAVEALDKMFAGMRAGFLTEPTNTVEKLLGRPATTFAQYAEQVWRTS